MTSARHIAANRENAKKSTGPRTSRGKSRASRNAIRHALSSTNFGDPGLSARAETLARAICNGDRNPFLYEQAVIIAESQILLGRIRAARVAAIQFEPVNTGARRDLILAGFPFADLDIVQANLNQGELGKVAKLIQTEARAFRALRRMAQTPVDPTRPGAQNLRQAWQRHIERPNAIEEPSQLFRQAENIILALPKVLSLERYERRALSRRKRALRRFNMLRD